jgi:hypothetical protein
MSRQKAQPLPEAVRIGPGIVGSELQSGAAARAASLDRPERHAFTDAGAASIPHDPDRLDLPAQGPLVGEIVQEAKLKGAHDPFAFAGDDEVLVGGRDDRSERLKVA